MHKTHSSTGTDDDWRDTITTPSILAALQETGNDAATPLKDRVMDAPREIRIYNLTDNPLLCQIVDFDGVIVNGGRMIVPGWFDGSTIAFGRNGAVCLLTHSGGSAPSGCCIDDLVIIAVLALFYLVCFCSRLIRHVTEEFSSILDVVYDFSARKLQANTL